MANKTIKYSKTDPTGTTTTNIFENFESWRYGEPAIPAELYFLGVDGNGYQQYFDTNGYGVEEVNATDSDSNQLFKINGKPIRGCVKGTVVTATNILASGRSDVEIWVYNGSAYYKTTDDADNKTKIEKVITTADGSTPKRLGIALIGGGGAAGYHTDEKWKNECHMFHTDMPGGGGGGGGIIWGIVNLESLKANEKYTVAVGYGGNSSGGNGMNTILSLLSPMDDEETVSTTLAIAGGGKGGGTGRKSGAAGGMGGTCVFTTDTNYFIKCGQKAGSQGGSYSELNIDNEGQYIGSSVESNKFEITFIPDSGKQDAGSDKHDGIGETIENIVKKEGRVYFAIPGGNSFKNGGYPMDNNSVVIPEWGGGGMCWTYNDNKVSYEWCESIWANTADAYIKDSSKARCGAKGGWILFY